jgi:DNA-binding transcriptional ArsR family regulator
MSKPATRAAEIEAFVLAHVGDHAGDIARLVGEHFEISRQAVSKHLSRLVDEGKLTASGSTQSRTYALASLVDETFELSLTPPPEEHRVWLERVAPLLAGLPDNVEGICIYGFTEMLNNAIEHSQGTRVLISLYRTALSVRLLITDDGVGIFHKIATELHLDDERHAILELAKGKLTTAPKGHSGEGIFFTSRMFDSFSLLSHHIDVQCSEGESWLLDSRLFGDDAGDFIEGTVVSMEIRVTSTQTSTAIFDRFSAPLEDDYGFIRTQVPVALARQGTENLVSRSQAKRLIARLDRFKEVILDFSDVPTVGQAFADEVFRVFAETHPDIRISWVHAARDVEKMIRRAVAARPPPAS